MHLINIQIMLENILDLSSEESFRYGISTVILSLIILVLRTGLHHSILERSDLKVETRRRWTVNIRNALIFLFIIGLVFIWAPQLQTFAVSLFAIAVAIAIAIKELIDCTIGSIVRAVTRSYSIGDRIEIAGIRGHVVDHNLFTTTLLEIGPGQTLHQYTGRAMILPNSFFLRHTMTNETYSKDYRLHIITIPLTTDDNFESAEAILLEAAQEECQSYLQEAKRKMKELEGKSWLDAPSVEPRITVQLPEPGRINLLLRIPCPTRFPSRLEQAILRKFLLKFSFAPRYAHETSWHSGINILDSQVVGQTIPSQDSRANPYLNPSST